MQYQYLIYNDYSTSLLLHFDVSSIPPYKSEFGTGIENVAYRQLLL